MVGAVTGAIAGLASITPASGYVGPVAALVIGLVGGGLAYLAVMVVKHRFKIDDSLDVLAVHGVGGATGILLAAVFVDAALGGVGFADGRTMGGQALVQLTGLIAVLVWSAVMSFCIIKIVQSIVGLRVSGETEEQGLDLHAHGERGYNM
jgi:ammonium transporter, Amt family